MKQVAAALYALNFAVCPVGAIFGDLSSHLSQNDLVQAPYQVLQVFRRTDPSFVQGLYFDIERN